MGNTANPSNNPSAPTCLCCAGPYRLVDHPPSITTFQDGRALFCSFHDGNLTVSKSRKTVCITFNLHWECSAECHNPKRIHVCSLCGGNQSWCSLQALRMYKILQGEVSSLTNLSQMDPLTRHISMLRKRVRNHSS